MFRSLVLALGLTSIAAAASGHEFWIEPDRYQVAPGDEIVAKLRVGQNFDGFEVSYIPPQFRRFDYVYKGQAAPVPGKIGDRPAARFPAPGDGLVVLVHQTKDSFLNWKEWDKFAGFVTHKDAVWTIARHKERGLPDTDFREVYSRYAKSLVAVGDGKGEDAVAGLLTEFVALENPYTDDMSDGMDVRLLYEGTPRADAQIEVFEKSPDDEVAVSYLRTDSEGRATVPVTPGHRYMLDAVVLREPAADLAAARSVVWESLWANLTFAVPGEG